MSQLHLEVVTPDQAVLSVDVDYVGVPGVEGQFGVLPGHVPLLSALAVGCLYYRVNNVDDYVFVAGGFADVSNDKVSILAESAELGCDIDAQRAALAKERAEKRLIKPEQHMDEARAQAALLRAVTRLQIVSKK